MKKSRFYFYWRTIASFACVLLLSPATRAADSTAYAVHTYTYKKTTASELQLDVFTPVETGKPRPVIVLFHGGSWISGDKAQLQWQCRYFVQQGMVAVTANYRLLEKGSSRKDICIMDAKSAVRWVKAHGAQLHIDTSRVILGGASAGGHLATMAVLSPHLNDPGDDTTISTGAKAEILFNPAYSTTGEPDMEPFRLADAGFPPVIFFFGSNDKWKPAADSLHTLLKQSKVRCETWIADGETHGFFNKGPWNEATCRKAQDFLVKCYLIEHAASPPAPDGLREDL